MINELKAFLQEREATAMTLLERLVLQNSFTENPRGGAIVADMLAAELQSIPEITDVRLIPSSRYAPHLVATTNGNHRDFVGLVGHLDTVFPPGTF